MSEGPRRDAAAHVSAAGGEANRTSPTPAISRTCGRCGCMVCTTPEVATMKRLVSKRTRLPRRVPILVGSSLVVFLTLTGCRDATAPSEAIVDYGMWVLVRGTVTGAPIDPDRRVNVQVLLPGCDTLRKIGGGPLPVAPNGSYTAPIGIYPHTGPLCVRAETPGISGGAPVIAAERDSVLFGSGYDTVTVTLDLPLGSS